MATADVWIYAPISGTIYSNGNGNYCSGGYHAPCKSGDGNCIDIAGVNDVFLRINSYSVVGSVKVIEEFYCAPGCADKYRRIITCELWQYQNLGGVYIGRVAFGHIDAPQYTGTQTVNMYSNLIRIGSVPSGTCGSYYTGAHSHIEYNPSPSTGQLAPLSCYNSIGTSDWMYRITYNF